MNVKELIEKYGEKFKLISNDYPYNRALSELWYDIKQLDEPQPVEVPQFMADWIEYFKKYSGSLYGSTAPYSYYGHAITDDFVGDVKKTLGWIRNNSETYARAWLDGYEVEKEKRYRVKIKGEIKENLLVYDLGIERYFFARTYDSSKRGEHTRKELEEAGFGWVLDCPGIELEEVE